MQKKTKLLIIGSGPAGYTAAVYASRALLDPILIQGIQPGGQLTITTEVENWPGEKEIQGPDLMTNLEDHAKAAGTNIINNTIMKLNLKKYPFLAISDNGNEYEAESIILATGAQAKWLGLKSEDKYKGFGVSACATCDGFFFRNEIIAVIGGGNTAVEEALFLTKFAKKVILIHRRDTLRAEKILQERLFNNPKVEVIWNSVLKEIIGIDNPLCVEAIKIENQKNNKEIEIACKGVFIAIGHAPSNELILNQLETHNGGYVVTKPNSTETSIPGVFAAGDITDFKYRQAVTAAGMGCMAALEAEKFLSEK
tara:strand:- start:1554 stop:2486 length:933 start_codon:yes stop_codon:yes gene_type:complete